MSEPFDLVNYQWGVELASQWHRACGVDRGFSQVRSEQRRDARLPRHLEEEGLRPTARTGRQCQRRHPPVLMMRSHCRR